MKTSVLLTLCIVFVAVSAVAAAKPLWHQLSGYSFEQYIQDFEKPYLSKSYNSGEQVYATRKAIFESNLQAIYAHNQDPTQTYKMGVNQFTDMTPEEFTAKFTGLNRNKVYSNLASNAESFFGASRNYNGDATLSHPQDYPTNFDWRNKIPFTPVKAQGGCGSCWAFASTAALESHVTIHTGETLVLAPQQLTSCSKNPDHCGGDGGCLGSIGDLAYGYIADDSVKGLALESNYPYLSGTDGQTRECRYNDSLAIGGVKIRGYTKVHHNNADNFYKQLHNEGPLVVNVATEKWMSYESGIFNGCSFNDVVINHLVVAVGWGVDSSNNEYWTIRNSWGPSWGEKGFMRLQRQSRKEQCGNDSRPLDGTECAGGPPSITVCGQCGIIWDALFPTKPSIVKR